MACTNTVGLFLPNLDSFRVQSFCYLTDTLQFAGDLGSKPNQFQSPCYQNGAIHLRHVRYQMSPLEY